MISSSSSSSSNSNASADKDSNNAPRVLSVVSVSQRLWHCWSTVIVFRPVKIPCYTCSWYNHFVAHKQNIWPNWTSCLRVCDRELSFTSTALSHCLAKFKNSQLDKVVELYNVIKHVSAVADKLRDVCFVLIIRQTTDADRANVVGRMVVVNALRCHQRVVNKGGRLSCKSCKSRNR